MLIDSDWEATSDFMSDVDTLSKGEVFHKEEDLSGGERKIFEDYMRKKQESVNISSRGKEKENMGREMYACRRNAGILQKYPAGIYCLLIPQGAGRH